MHRALMVLVLIPALARCAEPAAKVGKLVFVPSEDQKNLPELYRMSDYSCDYTLTPVLRLAASGVGMSRLTFPSSTSSKWKENNVVHAEYYYPLESAAPRPGVIVLDVIGGDQSLSRRLGLFLAANDIPALFVQMAHYGPRRAPDGPKLVSTNVPQSVAGIVQTVCDVRCATAWLAARPEVDPDRLGIHGTSLGSFISGVTAAMEPRLGACSLLIGGGNLVDNFLRHPNPKASAVAPLVALVVGRAKLHAMIDPVDPFTWSERLKNRRMLFLPARRDDVVPPQAATDLWESTGKQKIRWLDGTHIGAALYAAEILTEIRQHYRPDPVEPRR